MDKKKRNKIELVVRFRVIQAHISIIMAVAAMTLTELSRFLGQQLPTRVQCAFSSLTD